MGLLKLSLVERDAAQYDIWAVAVLTAFSEDCQNTVDVVYLPTSVVADAAGPPVFPGTKAKQT
ncbi:hypothetical protein TUM20903_37520 [Citrobacter koseri]|nr:hypothetical protein TUM13189_37730 [Citrobacter koseri]BDG91014.1 hypothetical protein TUM20903_37520 [Citrobacter koseri]